MNVNPEPIPANPLGDLRAELEGMRGELSAALVDMRAGEASKNAIRKVRNRLGDICSPARWEQLAEDVEDAILAADALDSIAAGEPTIPMEQVKRELGLGAAGPVVPVPDPADPVAVLVDALPGARLVDADRDVRPDLDALGPDVVRAVASALVGIRLTCATCGADLGEHPGGSTITVRDQRGEDTP